MSAFIDILDGSIGGNVVVEDNDGDISSTQSGTDLNVVM